MDPRFLERDEIQLELDIRGQDTAHPQAVDLLRHLIEEEVSNIRGPPTNVHSTFRSINSELSVLYTKLKSINEYPTNSIEDLSKSRARLLHIYGRVLRLSSIPGDQVRVSRVKDDIWGNLTACTNMLNTKIGMDPSTNICTNLEVEANRQAQVLQDQLLVTSRPTDSRTKPSTSGAVATRNILPSTDVAIPSTAVPQSIPPVTESTSAPPADRSSLPVLKPATSQASNPSTSNRSASPPHAYPSSHSAPQQEAYPPVSRRSAAVELAAYPSASHVDHLWRSFAHDSQQVFQPRASYPSYLPPSPSSLPPPAFAAANSLPQPRDLSQGLTMAKWPLRFGGGPKDLPVDEFIFRTETLARLSNIPQSALTLGLHQLLTGSAASWYWIFLRNQPNATWTHTRAEIIRAFQTNMSDAAIRRQIMDRLQRPSEKFVEFQLAIQQLEVRLARRMSEAELLETLRRNMLPHIQDKLLFLPIDSVYELQGRVFQVEDLLQRQREVIHLQRSIPRIHEIGVLPPSLVDQPHFDPHYLQPFLTPPPPFGHAVDTSFAFAEQIPFQDTYSLQSAGEPGDAICAIGSTQNRNPEFTCWNCDVTGHTYMNCERPPTIFCYGCGAKNVFRPRCPKCSLLSVQGNVRGSMRQNPNPQAQTRPGVPMLRHPGFHPRPQ